MKKILEMLTDNQDSLCPFRLIMAISFFMVFIAWAIVSLKEGKLADIPSGMVQVLWGILTAMVGKSFADLKDKPSPP